MEVKKLCKRRKDEKENREGDDRRMREVKRK